ncbi:MAG: ACT domain-containing protein [Halieaceae bacterium]|nr:ACT domain-containing protein [Halieaceae bacterium]
MTKPFLLSIIGDDKPGLVDAIASCVADNEGNWQTSQLTHLAGKFAGIVLITLPIANADALAEQLKTLSSTGLSVRVSPAESSSVPATEASLSVIGPDRPGIIREISQAFSRRNINMLKLNSDIVPAPMTNEPLFQATIDISFSQDQDRLELESALDFIAEDMTVEIDIDYRDI